MSDAPELSGAMAIDMGSVGRSTWWLFVLMIGLWVLQPPGIFVALSVAPDDAAWRSGLPAVRFLGARQRGDRR